MRKLAVLLLLGWLVGLPACSKKTPTAPPVVTGILAVTTDPPGAVLSLDGVEKGTTPLTLSGLALGMHALELSKFYYITWSESLGLVGADTLAKSYRLYPWGTMQIWGRDSLGWRESTLFYIPVDSVVSTCTFSLPARAGDQVIVHSLVDNTVLLAETLTLVQGATGAAHRWFNVPFGAYGNAFYWRVPGAASPLFIVRGKFAVGMK